MDRFKRTEDPATFFSLISPDGCWEWSGARDKNGYGQTKIGMRSVKAHRKIWAMLYGGIPEGLMILHHCDNPPCVRPNHLFLGTAKTNRQDAASKGHIPPPIHLRQVGENNPSAKLTADDVRDIRARYATGTISQKTLGEEFGLEQASVSHIIHRKSWKHI